jgi:hypothetical protein
MNRRSHSAAQNGVDQKLVRQYGVSTVRAMSICSGDKTATGRMIGGGAIPLSAVLP